MVPVSKLLLFPVLMALACLVAGVYGAVHNQISYTVSPEYFHGFKFDQFGIPPSLHNRAGAAVVGFLASWWMGILIGIPVLSVGLILPGGKTYFTGSLVATGIVAITALVVGLVALAGAYAVVGEGTLSRFHFPAAVHDRVAFARAGVMHTFSYLGGFLGILTASVYLIVVRVRLTRTRPATPVSGPPATR